MANPIAGFFVRWRYRKSVWAAIRRLLGPMAKLEKVIMQAYPGIDLAIRNGGESGQGPEAIALQIVSAVLTTVIENQMDPEDRRRALLELNALANGDDPPAEPLLLVRVFTSSLGVADQWVAANRVDSYSSKIFSSEVLGALMGKDSETRQATRIGDSLRGAVLQRLDQLRTAPFDTPEEQEKWVEDAVAFRDAAVDLELMDPPDDDRQPRETAKLEVEREEERRREADLDAHE